MPASDLPLPTPGPRGPRIEHKIKPIDELARLTGELRAAGRRVVHCHGVFDPLHIGHIRHFERAKELGDVLVVTVTPDEHVNKGPHRPIFSQDLRAEAIAWLETVDYVAVNAWPTAVEAIQRLQPAVFVKGAEFRDAPDRTGALALEEQAVRSVGGRLEFTDDVTFSASHLMNRHLGVFSPELRQYLEGFASRHASGDVLGYLESARALRVLVVGEAVIDAYHYCEAIGKSSKEPTLVVKHQSVERFAGGALALANHLAGCAAQARVLTFLGRQDSQEDFIRGQLRSNVEPDFLYWEAAPTIVKRRYVESYFLHKLFEVHEIDDGPLRVEDQRALCDRLRGRLHEYDLVVVTDLGHGLLGPEAIELLCREAPYLVVNKQSSAENLGFHTLAGYPRADFVCVAENEMRLEAQSRRGDLRQIVRDVAERLACPRMVVTRGKFGCLCYDRQEGFCEVPAFATQVVDRIGAGDAFLSLAALYAFQRAPLEQIGFVGNAAGAQAVATVGNRQPLQAAVLSRYIEHLLK